MDLEGFSDDDLLLERRSALEEVPKLHTDRTDRDQRRAAWQRVIDAARELERVYPPESDPLP
jgi:hypothetical protein